MIFMKINKYIIGVVIVISALLYRMLPNLPNFSPVAATFLFAGVVFSQRKGSFWLVLGLLYLSDFALNNTILRGFYPEATGLIWFSKYMIFTMLSYVLIFAVGRTLKKIKVIPIVVLSVLSSTIFFLLTNAGAWIFDPLNLYPDSLSGLIASYLAGLPFYQTSLVADLVFSAVLFGSYVAINRIVPKPLNA